jgi:HK97 gp10 family phage protein
MSLEINVRIDGLDELITKLRDFTSQADSIIQETMLESAKVNIVTVAKTLAPFRTGALRASIDAFPSGESPMAVNVVADRSYAKYLEFGTRYIPEGKYSFLRPAVQEGIEQLLQDVKNAIGEALSSR